MNKNARRAQILSVATQIFVEKGYYDTRTKDIAIACKVSEPVIYKHFKSKNELFLEVIAHIAGSTFNEINFNLNEDSEHIISSFILNRVKTVGDNFPLFKRLLIELLKNEEIRQYYFEKFMPRLAGPFINYLDGLKKQNLIKQDVPSKVIALALLGIFLMVSLAKDLDERTAFQEIPGEVLASQMLHIYLYGLLKD